jgi:hypothetical protein
MVSSGDIWRNFHLPAGKVVLGVPAFGLRYNAINGNGNNLDWGSYDYVTYNAITALDPNAQQLEYVNSAQGIYYNGIPLVTEKGTYIKTSPYKGAYMWTVDYDSPLPAKSLMQALYTSLQ